MSTLDRCDLPANDRHLSVRFGQGQSVLHKSNWSRIQLLAAVLWLVLFGVELLASLYLSDGCLVFTLDDPYVHLAVADHILSGGYGVNASEYSSPSSSIIWPYLMAATEVLRLGAWGPLLINAMAMLAAVVCFVRIVEAADFVEHPKDRLLGLGVACCAVIATSAIALPMTGMEHSLHVWASIVTFGGLAEAARGRPLNVSHFGALLLLPLVRFEGAAFAVSATVGFALLGKRRFAASAALAMSCSLLAYAALMASRGLPLLPSSVLLKSRIAENAYGGSTALTLILDNLRASLVNPYGFRLTLIGLAIVSAAWLLRFDRKVRIVCAAALFAIGAHLAVGQYDWFHRYEVYVIALAALTLFYAVANLKPKLTAPQWTATRIGVLVLVGFASAPYIFAALETPFASRGIYEQQYQVGLFAKRFYNQPVAVNDLGLVAYQNPNFVLDLWGLGSERVRRAKLAGHFDTAEMAKIADEHDVGLVMIYDQWFPQGVPSSWTKVAILHTQPVTAAWGDVSFYATPAAHPNDVESALATFARSIPKRDRLEITAR